MPYIAWLCQTVVDDAAALVQIDKRNFRGLAARRPIHRAESPACEIHILNCNGASQHRAGASGKPWHWVEFLVVVCYHYFGLG